MFRPEVSGRLANGRLSDVCSFQLETYIQDSMRKEMAEMQQNAVQNQTAVMLEIGTNLLNQTAEQTRKLTDVEAQASDRTDARGPARDSCTKLHVWLSREKWKSKERLSPAGNGTA